ncbi:MAG: hypothetical protein IPN75_19310 [Dechloromonas sp.]|uniref:Uncharacterized protein n=1 Tax=Candidatus Dechloromonas phosphorivorans TaxID=2899244 RepID=A0A9D7LTW7_9RHOO|nr:hypothetical protein [Candidatus Dechloromonas phosphorivorans]
MIDPSRGHVPLVVSRIRSTRSEGAACWPGAEPVFINQAPEQFSLNLDALTEDRVDPDATVLRLLAG